LAEKNGALDGGIVGNDTTGYGERGLEEGDGGEVGDSEFVGEAVAVGIGVEAKAFFGLHAVVMIHGVVGELANRDYRARLLIRKDEQAGRRAAGGREAGRWQADNFGSVPGAIGVVRENTERNTFGHE